MLYEEKEIWIISLKNICCLDWMKYLFKLNCEVVINDCKMLIKGVIDVVVLYIIWRLNSVKYFVEL